MTNNQQPRQPLRGRRGDLLEDSGWDWSSTVVVILFIVLLLLFTMSLWVPH